jgi:hypothetical protein
MTKTFRPRLKETAVALSAAVLLSSAAALPAALAHAAETPVQIAAGCSPCNPCAAKAPCNPCAAN